MKKIILLFSIVVCYAGCASIVKGGRQSIVVDSNVKGADVFLGDKLLGQTALQTIIDKDGDAVLTVSKKGYQTQKIKLTTRISGWFWGNIIIGGTLGSSTDSSTGAMYEYAPDKYYVQLKPEKLNTMENKQFNKEAHLRYFVLMNYDRINKDIAVGNGEYLDSLYELYSVKKKSQQVKLLNALKTIQKNAITMVEFSDKLVKLI